MRGTNFGLLLCAGLPLYCTSTAQAFCLATTCDPIAEECPIDANGCPEIGPNVGVPLYWPTLCVSYAVHQAGSPLREITGTDADNTLGRAFQAWISANCGNEERPSLGIIPFGSIQCDRPEFNPPNDSSGGAPNANILIFRDSEWPYGANTIDVARTTLTFDVATGEIFDADIEVNSFANALSLPGDTISQDLQAILTHEAGHFLGLAHSRAAAATMNAQYELDDLAYRTLSADDVQGVCALYPPQGPLVCPVNAAPTNGFAMKCQQDAPPFIVEEASCLSLASPPLPSNSSDTTWCLALLFLAAARRKGSHRTHSVH